MNWIYWDTFWSSPKQNAIPRLIRKVMGTSLAMTMLGLEGAGIMACWQEKPLVL